ncbi:MAG TPA: protein kinase [Polyangiaceae bacterium]
MIERWLGMGGSGVVVCARHRVLEQRFAIKFLLPTPDADKALARFQSEARAAMRVKNEHVVRISDIEKTSSGIHYIVMEYLEGLDLERMLHRTPDRRLSVADAIDFILQACEAIAESHELGIVHRDLKPSNLFCLHGSDGLPMIKVLDFGISKLASSIDTATTGASHVLGSPRYMSPEQFESSHDVDRRTDIWSLGILLYEFLTGEVPFADPNLFRLRQRIRLANPRPMIELRPDLPPGIQPVVFRCLGKEREGRFANIAELAKALLPCAPPRSRGSVARIVRIVESPGCTTGALSISHDALSGDTPTISGVSLSVARDRRWMRVVGALLLPVALLALVGLWRETHTWLASSPDRLPSGLRVRVPITLRDMPSPVASVESREANSIAPKSASVERAPTAPAAAPATTIAVPAAPIVSRDAQPVQRRLSLIAQTAEPSDVDAAPAMRNAPMSAASRTRTLAASVDPSQLHAHAAISEPSESARQRAETAPSGEVMKAPTVRSSSAPPSPQWVVDPEEDWSPRPAGKP